MLSIEMYDRLQRDGGVYQIYMVQRKEPDPDYVVTCIWNKEKVTMSKSTQTYAEAEKMYNELLEGLLQKKWGRQP